MTDSLDASPLVIPTKQESTADRLRNLILTRHLRPGERLVQSELAEQLGVSRTPIREALYELASDGLVVLSPHKGASVADFSLEDLKDIKESMMRQIGKLHEPSGDNQPSPTAVLSGKGATEEAPAMRPDIEQAQAERPEEKSQVERSSDLQAPAYLASGDQPHRAAAARPHDIAVAPVVTENARRDALGLIVRIQLNVQCQDTGIHIAVDLHRFGRLAIRSDHTVAVRTRLWCAVKVVR